jgi:acetylglutamate synthase
VLYGNEIFKIHSAVDLKRESKLLDQFHKIIASRIDVNRLFHIIVSSFYGAGDPNEGFDRRIKTVITCNIVTDSICVLQCHVLYKLSAQVDS